MNIKKTDEIGTNRALELTMKGYKNGWDECEEQFQKKIEKILGYIKQHPHHAGDLSVNEIVVKYFVLRRMLEKILKGEK